MLYVSWILANRVHALLGRFYIQSPKDDKNVDKTLGKFPAPCDEFSGQYPRGFDGSGGNKKTKKTLIYRIKIKNINYLDNIPPIWLLYPPTWVEGQKFRF